MTTTERELLLLLADTVQRQLRLAAVEPGQEHRADLRPGLAEIRENDAQITLLRKRLA